MRKNDAVALFGTQEKLAEALDCAQSTVAGWKDELIPLKRALQIKRLKPRVRVDLELYGISRQPSQ